MKNIIDDVRMSEEAAARWLTLCRTVSPALYELTHAEVIDEQAFLLEDNSLLLVARLNDGFGPSLVVPEGHYQWNHPKKG
jgi:hypothetical protein